MLIVFGMIGLAIGAFQWSASPWFVALKLAAAGFVIDHGPAWLLAQQRAVVAAHATIPRPTTCSRWLDGALIVAYIGATALVLGGIVDRIAARGGERYAHERSRTRDASPMRSSRWPASACSSGCRGSPSR